VLTISPEARDVIRLIPEQPTLPGSAGLRITVAGPHRRGLYVRTTASPGPEDRVFDYEGARIFLGPIAVRRLQDRHLDVRRGADGRLHFVAG
jgi:iron-sulfur cluster assembly protein